MNLRGITRMAFKAIARVFKSIRIHQFITVNLRQNARRRNAVAFRITAFDGHLIDLHTQE